jgi:hypothetical protein
MRRWTKIPIALAALWVGMQAAGAQTPDDRINVKGNVPAVCTLGVWEKQSGPGTFTSGYNAVATYSDSDLVGPDGFSALGPGSALTFHAPLYCNTGLTWTLNTEKGALRLDSASAPPPSGFADRWLYHLTAGPYKADGNPVQFIDALPSNGTPADEGFILHEPQAVMISYMGIVFSPDAQFARMLAGHYSETVTLTVSPAI